MDTQFTLKEIENTYEEAKDYLNTYKKSIDELNRLINELSQSWISKETTTYEDFYSNYKYNYTKLIRMQQMMETFCEKLDMKKIELTETSRIIKNEFE